MTATLCLNYTLSSTEPFSGQHTEYKNINFSSAKKFQKSVSGILEKVEPGTHFVIKRYVEIRAPWYKFRKSAKKRTVYLGDIEFWVMNYPYSLDDLKQQAIEHNKTVDFYPSIMPRPHHPAVVSFIHDNKALCNNLTPNHIIVDRNLCDLRGFDIPARIVQFIERPYEY